MNRLIYMLIALVATQSFIVIDNDGDVDLFETEYVYSEGNLDAEDLNDININNVDSILKLPLLTATGNAGKMIIDELTRRFSQTGDNGPFVVYIFNNRKYRNSQALATPYREFSYKSLLGDTTDIRGVLTGTISGCNIPIILKRYNTVTPDSVIDEIFKATSDSVSFRRHLRIVKSDEPVYQCNTSFKDTYLWWKIVNRDSIVLKQFVYENEVIEENSEQIILDSSKFVDCEL